MPFKTKLKIVIGVMLAVSVMLGILTALLFTENQEADDKAAVASRIMLKVFEKRVLADEYSFTRSDRARRQWLAKQPELEQLVIMNEALFAAASEREPIALVKKSLLESVSVFEELSAFLEGLPTGESGKQLEAEKAARLSSQLLIKSQETIAAASRLKDINDALKTDTLHKIMAYTSVVGGLFGLMLLIGFWIIWIDADTLVRKKSESDSILGGIGDAVFAIDTHKNIILFNRSASELTGLGEKEALGSRYDDVLKFINEKTGKQESAFIETALSGVKAHMPSGVAILAKSGKKIPIADSASPIVAADGSVAGIVVVFRDITLELELNRAKEEFVSLASHQLRTPLTAIKGYSGMLLEGDVGKLNEKQREYMLEINTANVRMIDLINGLLNVSRIDMGVFAIEPLMLELSGAAGIALGELELKIGEKGIRIAKQYDKALPKISADPKLIGIIFQNLLSNAVKYTPAGGTVRIAVEKRTEDAYIAVTDSGMGIPRIQQDKIFSKFFRADNARAADPDGTGLGLYVVKAVVDAAGGKIWFDSIEDRGTTFHVTLPLIGMKKREGTKGLN